MVKKIDKKLVYLFSMMNLDYLLTKLGIFLNFIIEGNFLMNWLIFLPLYLGLPIRIVLSFIILFPIYLVRNKNQKLYNFAVKFGLIVNFIILIFHCFWILFLIII